MSLKPWFYSDEIKKLGSHKTGPTSPDGALTDRPRQQFIGKPQKPASAHSPRRDARSQGDAEGKERNRGSESDSTVSDISLSRQTGTGIASMNNWCGFCVQLSSMIRLEPVH